ncbi:MAG: hypothetical protein HKN53_11175 [Maribacter sp.]|nr:hypothetical protein [Maribacter sp.]
MDQALFQFSQYTDSIDGDTNVQRVNEIDDVQFGKGAISSVEGVGGCREIGGGFNLVKISINPY